MRRALWFSSKVTGKPFFHPNLDFGSTAVTHPYPRAMGWGLRSERRKYVFPFLEIQEAKEVTVLEGRGHNLK